jgi:hypothetical protein
MHKATYRLAIVIAIIGILLFIPIGALKGPLYNKILILHIILGVILGIMLIRLVYSHVSVEISNPFKRGVKKWNGMKLLIYFTLAILSGLIIVIYHIPWLIYFHGFIGLWSLLVGWKHKR